VFNYLRFADSKYFITTVRANTLSGGASVLHGNRFGILHFNHLSVFHAICLHIVSP
jgi:hypothetical protein